MVPDKWFPDKWFTTIVPRKRFPIPSLSINIFISLIPLLFHYQQFHHFHHTPSLKLEHFHQFSLDSCFNSMHIHRFRPASSSIITIFISFIQPLFVNNIFISFIPLQFHYQLFHQFYSESFLWEPIVVIPAHTFVKTMYTVSTIK